MIIDTSVVLAAFERRSAQAIDAIKSLGGSSVRSWIVEAELLTGVRTASNSVDQQVRRASFDAYRRISTVSDGAGPFDAVPYFAQAAETARRQRIRIGQNDVWILAHARVAGCGVLTADTAMFEVGEAFEPGLATLV